jgi:hypothetical protein
VSDAVRFVIDILVGWLLGVGSFLAIQRYRERRFTKELKRREAKALIRRIRAIEAATKSKQGKIEGGTSAEPETSNYRVVLDMPRWALAIFVLLVPAYVGFIYLCSRFIRVPQSGLCLESLVLIFLVASFVSVYLSVLDWAIKERRTKE